MRRLLKKLPWYREIRYIYRAFFIYHRPFSYLWHRFVIGPRIRYLRRSLDRSAETTDYSIHLLCSHSDLTMLLWSVASFYRVMRSVGALYVHEDGSFTSKDYALLSTLLPHARVVARSWASKQAQTWLKDLPATRALRQRSDAIFMTKLVDPRFVSQARVRLLLDGDVLWLKEPEEIVALINKRKYPFFTQGYTPMDFTFRDGSKLPAEVQSINAGIIGYPVHAYNLTVLEDFCAKIGPESNLYFVEQAGHAYILSKKTRVRLLNEQHYHIKHPIHPKTIAKHYTGPRREMFWFEGIRTLKKKLL